MLLSAGSAKHTGGSGNGALNYAEGTEERITLVISLRRRVASALPHRKSEASPFIMEPCREAITRRGSVTRQKSSSYQLRH